MCSLSLILWKQILAQNVNVVSVSPMKNWLKPSYIIVYNFFLLTSWSKMQILISIRGLVAYCFKQYDRLPTRRSKNGTSLELFSNLNVINPDHLESYLKWVNQSLFSFLWWNNRWIDDLKDNSITASCCLPDKCYLSQINLNELDL